MEERKENILEQIANLFFRYGIRSVTMDDIANEIGISKKTLYQYFKDKEDLVWQFVEIYFLNNKCFRVVEEPGLNAIDRVLKIRERMLKIFKLLQNNLEFDLRKSYPQIYRKIVDFKREKVYEDNFSVMEQGVKEGLFREDIDVDFLSRLAVGRFLLVFNPDHGIFSEEETHRIELFDKVIDYHFHGICTENGLEYYKQQLNNVQNEN